LPSNSAANGELVEKVQWAGGDWQRGDRFALLSDALGQWVWRSLEAGTVPWAALEELHRSGQQRSFAEWVDGLRQSGELRNDDVTAVLVAVT